MPGVPRSDLAVMVDRRTLRIEGSRQGSDGWSALYPVPEGYDLDAATAQLEDGVLTVRIPKKQRVEARRIEIA